jgi:cobalt/nickel transport system permease protein
VHIPDGFLSTPVAVTTYAASAVALAYALRRAGASLDDKKVPLLGVTAAFIFAAQMLNFPVAGGTSGHFLGAALATILLGPWLACIVLAVVLTGQAFIFADGGLTALGAAILAMAVIAPAATVGIMALAGRLSRSKGAFLGATAVSSWSGIMVAATAISVVLAVSDTIPFGTVLPAMLGVHALIGIGEAVITTAAIAAVLVSRPDLIAGAGFAPPVEAPAKPAPGAAVSS